MIKMVVMVLTVLDSSSGLTLKVIKRDWDRVSKDPIEECRAAGVDYAKGLTKSYQTKYPYAFTNVDCHWETKSGAPA